MIKSKENDLINDIVHPEVIDIANILHKIGLNVFVIGARSLIMLGVNIGRETKDWDLVVDKVFTTELRDKLTGILRKSGYKVQWRKWGLLLENDIHVDINYAPLTLDEEFIKRSIRIGVNLRVPSLEDLVILKLMSGERKDIADLKKILLQSWNSLDKEYLDNRLIQTGLEREFEKILKRMKLK